MMRWVFRYLPKPDHFIYCSRALQQEVGASVQEACPRAGQDTIHNCSVVDDFHPNGAVHTGRPRLAIVANLLPVKGHLDFLDMAHELTSAGIDAEYWIIGTDVHRSGYQGKLEARTRELGLEKKVSFLGHCRNVPELLKQVDVVVCASHVEPFGICLTEAMASAKPVVATRVGGIPEVVEDGVTGILVPPKAPAELARAVRRLLQDPALGQQMGLAGRKRVEAYFTHEVHGAKVVAIYQRLLARQETRKPAGLARCS
jgi:glycosyltransferase involved in cell wall biosynthesis